MLAILSHPFFFREQKKIRLTSGAKNITKKFRAQEVFAENGKKFLEARKIFSAKIIIVA